MSETPICPRCNQPFSSLSAHDRQALALAGSFRWVCGPCFGVGDDNGTIWSIATVKAQERSHFLAIIQTLRTVETPKTLQTICETFRSAFAPESQVRYAWAEVGPELLRELWAVMEKIGGIVPPSPEVVTDKPRGDELYIRKVLNAIGDVVRWCEANQATASREK